MSLFSFSKWVYMIQCPSGEIDMPGGEILIQVEDRAYLFGGEIKVANGSWGVCRNKIDSTLSKLPILGTTKSWEPFHLSYFSALEKRLDQPGWRYPCSIQRSNLDFSVE